MLAAIENSLDAQLDLPGEAELSMTVTGAMTNGHGIAHGGFIFLLADTAFAYACNSYNQRCLAQHCSITYLQPAREGSRLIAEAREVRRVARSGVRHCGQRRDGRGHRRVSRPQPDAPGSFF